MTDLLRQAREALRYMHDEKCDYMRRKNLGDPTRETAYKLAVEAIAALDAALAAPVAQPSYSEGINVPRLSRALTKMGCAHETSEEAIAASLADHVNRLTQAIAARDMTDAAIRASCATTVFLTALEAQADDADDLGVQGWLDLAEERIRKGV